MKRDGLRPSARAALPPEALETMRASADPATCLRVCAATGELSFRSRCVGQLAVERLAVSQAPPQELRPVGHTRNGIARLWEQSPQIWMVPAELMARAIPVLPNSGPQPFHFSDERIAIQGRKVFIHRQRNHAGLSPGHHGSACSPPLTREPSRVRKRSRDRVRFPAPDQ